MPPTPFTLRVAGALTRQTELDLGRVGYLLALLERASNTDPRRVRAVCDAAGVDPLDVGVVDVGSWRGLCRALGLVSARGNPSTARARTLLAQLGDLRLAAPIRVGGRLLVVLFPAHVIALDPHATRDERAARVEWAHGWSLDGETDQSAIGGGDRSVIALPLYRDRGMERGGRAGAHGLGAVGDVAERRHGGSLPLDEVTALAELVAEHGPDVLLERLSRGAGHLRSPARWLRVVMANAPRTPLEARIVEGIPQRKGRAPVEALSPRQREQLAALVADLGEPAVSALVDAGVGAGCDWPVRAIAKHAERQRRPQASASARLQWPVGERERRRREWVMLGAPEPTSAAPATAPLPVRLVEAAEGSEPAADIEADAEAAVLWGERRAQLDAHVAEVVEAAGLVAVGMDDLGDVLLDGHPDGAARVACGFEWPLRLVGARVRRPYEGDTRAPRRGRPVELAAASSMARLAAAAGVASCG